MRLPVASLVSVNLEDRNFQSEDSEWAQRPEARMMMSMVTVELLFTESFLRIGDENSYRIIFRAPRDIDLTIGSLPLCHSWSAHSADRATARRAVVWQTIG